MEINFIVPNWIMHTLAYSILITAILMVWGLLLRAFVKLCVASFGVWVFRAAVGLYKPGGNKYDSYTIKKVLKDIEKKTGVKYIKKVPADQEQWDAGYFCGKREAEEEAFRANKGLAEESYKRGYEKGYEKGRGEGYTHGYADGKNEQKEPER